MSQKEAPENTQSEISRLREVLFGQQFKDHEQRSARFEDRILHEIEELRKELDARFKKVEERIGNFSSEFDDHKKSAIKTDSDIRQSIQKQQQEFSSELARINKEFSAQLRKEVSLMDDLKLSRSALTGILGEAIMQVNAAGKVGPESSEHKH